MRVRIVSTTSQDSKKGNRVTAYRWAEMLGELGHESIVEKQFSGGDCDLLVALHARRSLDSVERFRAEHPDRPLILALTGTDLYQDLPKDPALRRVLDLPDLLITLQDLAIRELPPHCHHKVRVIIQSAVAPADIPPSNEESFTVAVVGHLRWVKDPFRAAKAVTLLPPSSRIQVLHVGAPLEDGMAQSAAEESRTNPRYTWMGEVDRAEALRIMGRSRVVLVTSLSEGGPNVIAEALACGVPVLSSYIPGSIGLLGEDYPGVYPVGDTKALAELLLRVETDAAFYAHLRARCDALRPRIHPEEELCSWFRILEELFPGRGSVDPRVTTPCRNPHAVARLHPG